MLPRQLPAVDTLFTVTVRERVDVEGDRVITTNDAGNDLVSGVNARLVGKVCKNVVANFCVTRISTILCLKSCGCVVVERA